MTTLPAGNPGPARGVDQLVFVGFRSQVVALDRDTGGLVWSWRSPGGRGYTAVLLDGDRLMVSVNGYMYCLAPEDGRELWANPLSGMGVGVPCLASMRGSTANQYPLLAAAEADAAAASAAAAGAAPSS
jgi:outer membrane protein assembly factor BamB